MRNSLYNPFSVLRHLDLWSVAAFETNGGGGGGGNDNDNDSTPAPAATTPAIPVYDNYYDAIDAEGAGATVNIGGKIVKAETADGYTGSGSTASDSYVDDTFGTGNIYTERDPGASTNNYGNTVSYNNDNDNDAPAPLAYTDTSNIAGISAASGVDYNPTAKDDDVSLDAFGGAGSDLSDDYVTNDGGISYTYDPIVSGGTGTSTGGTGGYDGSTYDEVPTTNTYSYDDDDEDYTPTSDELNAAIDAAGGVNLTDSEYAEPVDYTTTGSGNDYTSTATSDDDDPYVAPDPAPPAPPPVYYDAVGKAYGSQAEAAAADAAAEAASAQAAVDMAAAFDEPTPAEIAAANASAQREAYDDDEYEVMRQPVSVYDPDPTGANISYADILSGSGVSDEEIASMRDNIMTQGPNDLGFDPLSLDIDIDPIDQMLSELGIFVDKLESGEIARSNADALGRSTGYDAGIDLESTTASATPSVITDLAMGDGTDTGGYDEAGMNVGMDIPDYEDEFDFVERQGPDLPTKDPYDFVNDLPDDALDFSAPVNQFDEIDDGTGTDFSVVPNQFDEIDDGTGTDFSTVFPAGESLTDDTLGTSPSFETQDEAIIRALEEALGDDIPTADQISPEDFRANEAALAGIDFETGLPIGGITPDEDIAKGGVLYESTIQSIKDRVSDVEGTSDAGGYDRLLGGQEGNFGVKPSEMTIAEVLAFQAKRGEGSYASYSQDVNKKNNQLREDGSPKISTPVGKYQVVGSTLQGLVDSGIVDINDKFDEATQEKIGTHLIENRGFQDSLDGTITEQQFEKNLSKEFQGIEFQGYNSDGTFTADPESDGASSTDLYLSAMDKVSDPSYDPDESNLSAEEQAALYGSRGQTPNAAETAYLQDLLKDVKHAEDGPIGKDGKPIYKAGDTVRPETFGDKAGDFLVGIIDALFNPFSILGGKFTLAGQIEGSNEERDKRVAEQLEAYKNGGTFVYDENGSVVGVAEANYDADKDGVNDTVVIFDEEGEIKVTGDGLDTTTIETSNEFSEEDDEIVIVESDSTYTNPDEEGGDVVITNPEVEVTEIDGSSDDNIPICEEGFEFDPEEGICMPIDEIGDGTGRGKVKIKKRPTRPTDTTPTPDPTPTPDVGGLIIRQPQLKRNGGVVTRNIDKFANGGVVTPNIDNFFGSMR